MEDISVSYNVIRRLAVEAGYEDRLDGIESKKLISISGIHTGNQAETMKEIVPLLIKEHNLFNYIETPYNPTGNKILISSNPNNCF